MNRTPVTIPEPFKSDYCMASGHSQFGCPGEGPQHHELYKLGYGISRVPGPTDAELREETLADRELMVDEYHGRDLDGDVSWLDTWDPRVSDALG